jgi:imidazoleglycerol phosphate dehydratase HisB
MNRTSTISRTTRETDIRISLALDGRASASISTGVGFLDHMLTSLATHARWDLTLQCTGDLHIDDHHTVEDIAIALGQALDAALGDHTNIARFAIAYAPLDEALARCVIDLVRRPHATINLALVRPTLGTLSTENLPHFFESFAINARLTLHLDVIRGLNDHHRAEAAFKALALALRAACAPDTLAIPSTKGTL